MQRIAAILSLVLASAAGLAQNTIVVPSPVAPTLTLALTPAVSGLQPGDTIELTTGAVYFDTYTITTPNITIRAADGQVIEINAFGVGSAFTVNVGNGSFTIEGLTIRNGNTGGNGGAINVLNAGALTATNSRFINNTASAGGAIFAINCDITLESCEFIDNTASVFGGAVRSGGFSFNFFRDTTFTGNRALGGNGGAIDHSGVDSTLWITDSAFDANTCTLSGGAVFSNFAGAVRIENTAFRDNVALGTASQDTGGVIVLATQTTLIRNCDFERNLCAGSGAALRFSGAAGNIIDCRFVDNAGSSGGAFQAVGSGAFARIYNSVFQGNSARRQGTDSAAGGGAIVVNGTGARVDVYNSLFVSNTAVTGGAITAFDAGILNVYNSTMVGNDADAIGGAIRRASTTASVIVNNSIFTGNLPTASQVAIAGQGVDEVFFSIVEGGYTGPGSGNLDADPMFVNASAGDYRLMPGSPAIDAGSSIRYVGGPFTDLVGVARVLDDPDTLDVGEAIFGAVIDIGAFEFQPTGPVITCPGDTNGDGQINFADLNTVLSVFGTSCD